MAEFASLPLPTFAQHTSQGITYLTDDVLASSVDVCVGFTMRHGGCSQAPYDSLNLSFLEDDRSAVLENRRRLLAALGAADMPLLVPKQIHGSEITELQTNEPAAIAAAQHAADQGSDGLLVCAPGVAALLCFADCLPAIIVAPSGRFSVVHAGWRGAYAGIVGKALRRLSVLDAEEAGASVDDAEALRSVAAQCNIYIGPHIHAECFEVGSDLAQQFQQAYGEEVLADERHIDLAKTVSVDAMRAGASVQRIADCGQCTKCTSSDFYSYRASGGQCGRHGAFALRKVSS